MTRLFGLMVFLAACFCGATAVADPAAAPVYQITGVVMSGVDEAPVPHAHLNATPATQGRPVSRFFPGGGASSGIGVDADEHGRFALSLPSAGAWHLTASATGFVTQAYEEHDNYSSAVVLTAAAPAIDLRFHLSPEAEITGTVLDEAGEAVRGARVTLQRRASNSPDRNDQAFGNRMIVQTDDRGIFEFDDLAEGDYRVQVDAKPWYSTTSQPRMPNTTLAVNPSLDVTYQMTWFPGVDDPAQAEILSLRPADNRRADFHLVPIPAVHLLFPAPPQQQQQQGHSAPFFPILERIDSGGGPVITQAASISGPTGQLDIGGLAPGLYRVRVPGQNQDAQAKVIEIASGSSRVVDAASAAAEITDITVEFDHEEEGRPLLVELINTENGRRFTSLDRNMFLAARPSRDTQQKTPPRRLSLQVPPGRYEISLPGRDTYLVGLTAKGAEVSGRFLTVRAGEVTLALHTGKGRATINGIAGVGGKPVTGATVLLVPAGMDDPHSFTRLARDQTNTDGSFDLNDVIPGQYILIAVDRGWKINWKDTTTLQKYLTQGVPLDLHANARVSQNISAQEP